MLYQHGPKHMDKAYSRGSYPGGSEKWLSSPVQNPSPKSKAKIQNPKSRGKGLGLGLTLKSYYSPSLLSRPGLISGLL